MYSLGTIFKGMYVVHTPHTFYLTHAREKKYVTKWAYLE